MQPDGRRDEEAVRRFVEHFALTLNDMGMARMPARVLAVLMVAEQAGLTASEISERLGVSPAAVSGAVRYLIQVGMAAREPAPGSRRDVYKVPPTSWYSGSVRRGVYERIATVVQEGVDAVGDETSLAGTRLAEMRDFFRFIQQGMIENIDRWEKSRQEQGTTP
ncbi:GbsR/MarR family transcriptional regulator [Micromonospora sp. NPDC050397]|uniref:GbsR/MarR family transcriptional regulator n=1 Tax=Micromonospora sp. NPDC050397 TaxID=3364279 RepID=UPI00384DCF4F